MKNQLPTLAECEDFLAGGGPTNSLDAALANKLNAAQLRDLIRQEKASMDAYIQERERKMKLAKKQRDANEAEHHDLIKRMKADRLKAKAAPAAPRPVSTPPARPLKGEATAVLARALKLASVTTAEKVGIRAELTARGVTILQNGYSESLKTN
jgi:hypothetical protein